MCSATTYSSKTSFGRGVSYWGRRHVFDSRVARLREWLPRPHNESTLPDAPRIVLPNGIAVDASCNETVTISCLKELYNVGKFNASAKVGNKIGITGYLEQFANIADLQLFYADQRPDAVNSTFEFISINGNGTVLCSCVYILMLYERWSKLTEYLRGWGRSES